MDFDNEELTVKLYHTDQQEARIVGIREYVIGAVAASMPPEFRGSPKAQAICWGPGRKAHGYFRRRRLQAPSRL